MVGCAQKLPVPVATDTDAADDGDASQGAEANEDAGADVYDQASTDLATAPDGTGMADAEVALDGGPGPQDAAVTDGPDCTLAQTDGCPCAKDMEQCCTMPSRGLSCSIHLPTGKLLWFVTYDCCRDPNPQCQYDPQNVPPWCNGKSWP